MVRKYGVYVKEGLKASKITMKRKGSRVSFYLFYLMYIISGIFLPFMKVASYRFSKQSLKVNDLDIIDAFKNVSKGKVFWNTFVSGLISAGIIFGGCTAIVGITCLLELIGSGLTVTMKKEIVILIFAIPGIILMVIYMIFTPLYFEPVAYICDTVSDLNGSNIVSRSVNAMRSGKRIVFLNRFIPTAVLSLIFGILGGAYVIVFNMHQIVLSVIVAVVVVAIFLVVLYFAPIFILGFLNATTLFFEDSVLDDVTEKRVVKGVYVLKTNNKGAVNENLINLFEKTEERHFTRKNKLSNKYKGKSVEYDEDDEDEIFEKELQKEEKKSKKESKKNKKKSKEEENEEQLDSIFGGNNEEEETYENETESVEETPTEEVEAPTQEESVEETPTEDPQVDPSLEDEKKDEVE